MIYLSKISLGIESISSFPGNDYWLEMFLLEYFLWKFYGEGISKFSVRRKSVVGLLPSDKTVIENSACCWRFALFLSSNNSLAKVLIASGADHCQYWWAILTFHSKIYRFFQVFIFESGVYLFKRLGKIFELMMTFDGVVALMMDQTPWRWGYDLGAVETLEVRSQSCWQNRNLEGKMVALVMISKPWRWSYCKMLAFLGLDFGYNIEVEI